MTPSAGASAAVATSSVAPASLPTLLLPGVGMSSPTAGTVGADPDEVAGPPPPCGRDEDCWSKTCCPARAPTDCVHAQLARRCAIVDLRCPPTDGARFTCVCQAGACTGRPAPG